jgi:hypothetical protein
MMSRTKAPDPGSYSGTVGRWNAILIVTNDTIEAVWHTHRSRLRFGQQSNAWDVTDGYFTPIHNREPVCVRFRLPSRITGDADSRSPD